MNELGRDQAGRAHQGYFLYMHWPRDGIQSRFFLPFLSDTTATRGRRIALVTKAGTACLAPDWLARAPAARTQGSAETSSGNFPHKGLSVLCWTVSTEGHGMLVRRARVGGAAVRGCLASYCIIEERMRGQQARSGETSSRPVSHGRKRSFRRPAASSLRGPVDSARC